MTFTTVNYNPVGLTSEMLNALIKSWRSTAWRIKVQRPGGVKLFDAATAITTKIDDGTYHPISTSGTKYIKIVKDEKHNRTFVLHKNGLGGNYAVVSIINHDKLTTDMDYIEVVNKNTAIDWPTLNYPSTAVYALDMDYNPDKDELVLALRGSRLPNPTYLQPALMTISTAKYLPEIALNTCSTLKPNPDYLKCTVFRAPDGYMDCVPGCYFKFVRYLGGRYWTWALVATSIDGLGSNPLWQLGYFSAISHAYTLCFQYGLSPDSGASGHPPASTRADGSAWANAVTYPTQPRYQQVNGIGATGLITGTTDGYIGDSTGGLSNVVTFEINPMNGGSIILGTSPTTIDGVVADLVSGDTLYGMGGATKSYGMEPFIYRISIPVLLTELTEASRYIQDKTVAISAVYDSKSGDYLIPAQNIEANFPTPEASILGRNGGGLSYTRCVMSFPGTAQLNQQNYLALDGGFGVSTFISSFDGNYGYKSHSIGAFVPGNSALGRLCFGDASSNAPFTITITFTLYKAIPGLIEVIGVHSEVPLCAIGNTERPLEVAGTITLNSVVTDISVASKHFPTTTKYLKLHAAQWSSTAQKYSLARLAAPCSTTTIPNRSASFNPMQQQGSNLQQPFTV